MCGSKPDLPPATDPKAERERIATEATASANARLAADRLNRRSQSLLSRGAQGSPGAAMTSSVLAIGKQKMGGGI